MGARSQRGARKKQVRGSPVHAAEASQTATGFVHGVASIAPWKGVADVDARRRKGCACIRLHPERVTDRFYHTYCRARDGDAGSGDRRRSSPLRSQGRKAGRDQASSVFTASGWDVERLNCSPCVGAGWVETAREKPDSRRKKNWKDWSAAAPGGERASGRARVWNRLFHTQGRD